MANKLPFFAAALGALRLHTEGDPIAELVDQLAVASGFPRPLFEKIVESDDARELYDKYPAPIRSITLPPPPAIHVAEREGAAVDPDDLKKLVELAVSAHREPWKKLEGKDTGEDWRVRRVADFGMDEGSDGVRVPVYVTTDHVHCSERISGAKEEAEWCVAARKLLPRLANALVERRVAS